MGRLLRVFCTSALTVDVIGGGGPAGQVHDAPVAAVDMLDGVAAQRNIDVKGEEHADAEQSQGPGQDADGVQPSRRHDDLIPERLAHGNVPADSVSSYRYMRYIRSEHLFLFAAKFMNM